MHDAIIYAIARMTTKNVTKNYEANCRMKHKAAIYFEHMSFYMSHPNTNKKTIAIDACMEQYEATTHEHTTRRLM